MHRMRGALSVLKCKMIAARCRELEMQCGLCRYWKEDLADKADGIASQLREAIDTYHGRDACQTR